MNGAESDVDCGGGACPTCAAGDDCGGGADCVSGSCDEGVCSGFAARTIAAIKPHRSGWPLRTNVLVRYLMSDDEEQARRAGALIEGAADRGEPMFVSHVVLCEMSWVLASVFRLPKTALVEALTDVVRTTQLVIEAPDLASRALHRFERGGADFADYLIAERATDAGCDRVATFDGKLLKEKGFTAP